MARIPLAIVLLLAVLATLASASVPSFCKCTCFQNSTIIPLGPQHDNNNNNNDNQPPPPPPKKPSPSSSILPSSSTDTNTNTNPALLQPTATSPATSPATRARTHAHPLHPLLPRESSTSCKQCNRAFCLKYNLPICKDAEEKDIKTSCFQRDSPKDRFIVWGFLLGTAGLLGWAALRRVIDSARERRRRRRRQQGGGVGGGMGMGGGGFGRFGGLMGGGNGGVGHNGQAFRTAPGGRVDREVYDPLEDGHDEGVTRGPG